MYKHAHTYICTGLNSRLGALCNWNSVQALRHILLFMTLTKFNDLCVTLRA